MSSNKTTHGSLNRENIYDIGCKQIIIEKLRQTRATYEELLQKAKSRVNMINLYVDVGFQILKNIPHNQSLLDDYRELQNHNLKILYDLMRTIENNIASLCHDEVQISSLPYNPDMKEELFQVVDVTYENTLREFEECLRDTKPISIKEYSKKKYRFSSFDDNFSNWLKLIIIGKRGSGKSSFINSIRNLNSFEYDENDNEKQIANTDCVECTLLSKFYRYSNTQGANIYLIDFPGVGTSNFPLEDYAEMVESMDADAIIYLFQSDLEDIDYKLIQQFKEKDKNAKIFLVKNKIDMIFENWLCAQRADLNLDELTEEQLDSLVEHYWPMLRPKLVDKYKLLFDKLKFEQNIYYISSNSMYRSHFDFEWLINELLNYLPTEKSHRFITELKKQFHSSVQRFENFLKKFPYGI